MHKHLNQQVGVIHYKFFIETLIFLATQQPNMEIMAILIFKNNNSNTISLIMN